MSYNSNYNTGYNTSYQAPQLVSYAAPEAQATFYRKTYSHVAIALLAFIAVETALQLLIPQELMFKMIEGKWVWMFVLGGFWLGSMLAQRWTQSQQYAVYGLGFLRIFRSAYLPANDSFRNDNGRHCHFGTSRDYYFGTFWRTYSAGILHSCRFFVLAFGIGNRRLCIFRAYRSRSYLWL